MQREESTKLIKEEEEFEAQEAWLEESQEFFMNVETDINVYLDSKEEVQSNLLANDEESLSSDTESLNKSNTHSELSVESNSMSDS